MSKKKKYNKTRPRFSMTSVEITDKEINPETGGIEISLEFDMLNGTNKVINNHTGKVIENTGFLCGYVGENKRRVTSQINTEKDDHSLCFRRKFRRFKHIVAIDTNLGKYQSKILKQEVSIGLGIAIALIEGDGNEADLVPLRTPFFTSLCPSKPENENWVNVIETLRKNCKCKDSRKIGIVVDSDLGNIPAYNKQEKPIFKEYYLPDEFELIFASDKVTDNIFNRIIKQSHKVSYELIPKVIEIFIKSEEQAIKEMNKK